MSVQLIADYDLPEGHGYHPGLALDTVIFGFHQNQLKILLLTYYQSDLFALPGGFIREGEDLNQAARRVLFERTGLTDIYLDQFYTFGDQMRHDTTPIRAIMTSKGIPITEQHWALKRFVTVGYYALVDFTKAVPNTDGLADSCAWYDFDAMPPLMLDHQTIVAKALETLRANLDHKLIGLNLLPETFTMADLQQLYETILSRPLNRSSFQRTMLNSGMLTRIEKKFSGGAHKAPYLYRFALTTEGSNETEDSGAEEAQ
ncbi:NUDIX hydrolase [Spirosoma pollinicola]|uniref:NUDIX hydrolase n=1 Tax=Spirosoma pollinicola TaxID=2057025 RepID=A0A2K8YRZ5_9BACT|nr:NUDIX domain-containing protein [Spirosoma pollinicola]AUD00396.1 NUDIX hydrolase [Spirosoma pollinicola]